MGDCWVGHPRPRNGTVSSSAGDYVEICLNGGPGEATTGPMIRYACLGSNYCVVMLTEKQQTRDECTGNEDVAGLGVH